MEKKEFSADDAKTFIKRVMDQLESGDIETDICASALGPDYGVPMVGKDEDEDEDVSIGRGTRYGIPMDRKPAKYVDNGRMTKYGIPISETPMGRKPVKYTDGITITPVGRKPYVDNNECTLYGCPMPEPLTAQQLKDIQNAKDKTKLEIENKIKDSKQELELDSQINKTIKELARLYQRKLELKSKL